MATIGPIVPGLPGFRAAVTATPRRVLVGGDAAFIAVNAIIDGTKTRDCGNTGDIDRLRPGLLMGKITSGGKYANSVLGLSGGALTSAGTSLTIPAATSTELARRIGATGTFKITGPPTAAGTVRTLTATYSALGATTATITALGVNQVEDIKFNVASTAGNLQLTVRKAADNSWVTTGNIAWNATDATYLASINTALDTATGVVGGIVATAIPSVDPDLGIRLTYSGTGYAGLPWTPAQVNLFPTSSTWAHYEAVTTAVDGRFVTSSLIQPTDGSETITTFVPDGYPLTVTDETGTSQDQPFSKLCVGGMIDTAQLIDYPADASLKTYVKSALDVIAGGKFIFSDMY